MAFLSLADTTTTHIHLPYYFASPLHTCHLTWNKIQIMSDNAVMTVLPHTAVIRELEIKHEAVVIHTFVTSITAHVRYKDKGRGLTEQPRYCIIVWYYIYSHFKEAMNGNTRQHILCPHNYSYLWYNMHHIRSVQFSSPNMVQLLGNSGSFVFFPYVMHTF